MIKEAHNTDHPILNVPSSLQHELQLVLNIQIAEWHIQGPRYTIPEYYVLRLFPKVRYRQQPGQSTRPVRCGPRKPLYTNLVVAALIQLLAFNQHILAHVGILAN
eukprot:5758269-Pleurochrysis_carterae.AAC.2